MNSNSLTRILLALISLLLSGLAYSDLRAEELAHFSFEAESSLTSDQFHLESYELQYRSHRRDLIFPYSEAAASASDWGLLLKHQRGNLDGATFSGLQAGLLVGRQFSPNLHLNGVLSTHTFSPIDQAATTHFTPELSLEVVRPNEWLIQVMVKRSLMFAQGYVPGPVHDDLTMWSLNSNATVFLGERVRLIFRPEISWPSDGNRRLYLDASLLYGFSLWPTWLWMGVGGEQLSNSERATYWSPARFHSYGLRFEINGTLLGPISGSLGLNLNKIREDNLKTGDGHYLNAGLMYGDRNVQNIKLEFTHVQSVQASSQWESSGLNLQWNYFF